MKLTIVSLAMPDDPDFNDFRIRVEGKPQPSPQFNEIYLSDLYSDEDGSFFSSVTLAAMLWRMVQTEAEVIKLVKALGFKEYDVTMARFYLSDEMLVRCQTLMVERELRCSSRQEDSL